MSRHIKKVSWMLPSLLLATASPHVLGQVYSGPVGIVNVTVPAASDAVLSVPLQRASEFQGRISSINGNEITLSGALGWTANQFAPLVTLGKTYSIQVASGSKEGLLAKIVGNTDSSVTVQLDAGEDLSGIAVGQGGDQLDIVPHWTPATLLSASMPSGTRLLLYSGSTAGVNLAASTTLQYNGTNWINLQSFANASNLALKFGDAFVLRNNSGSAFEVSMVGAVPMNAHRVIVRKLAANLGQDNRIGYLSPVPEVLGQVGLGFSAGDRLLAYNNAATGLNKSPSITLQFNGTGWINLQTFQDVTNTFTLQPGTGYIYRRPAAAQVGDTAWTDLQSYLQQ